jgi:hypothetical protein
MNQKNSLKKKMFQNESKSNSVNALFILRNSYEKSLLNKTHQKKIKILFQIIAKTCLFKL